MEFDVVCAGQSCVDVLVRGLDASGAFRTEISEAETIKMEVGGDAVNQSIVTAKLGLKSKLVCGVGHDGAGKFLKDAVAESGADVSSLCYTEKYATGITIVIISPDGQRKFIAPDDEHRIDFAPPDEFFTNARVVSIASMMLKPFITRESVERIIKPASERGSVICADVMSPSEKCRFSEFHSVMKYVDYIFPNEDEAAALTGKDSPDDIADFFLGLGVKNVVIKTGRRGCFLKNSETRVAVPAFDSPVVDTTGAGDNFASGFIKSIIEKKPLPECCLYANAVAGVAVGRVGANSGVTSRKQIDEFIASRRQLEIA
jgi:sugar/nucleoside kinase (ribokinase family)